MHNHRNEYQKEELFHQNRLRQRFSPKDIGDNNDLSGKEHGI